MITAPAAPTADPPAQQLPATIHGDLSGSPSHASGAAEGLLVGAVDAGPGTNLLDSSFRFAAQQLQLSSETGSLVARMQLVQRNLGLEPTEVFADLVLTGFARLDGSTLLLSPEQIQESLHSGLFIDGLDQLRRQLQAQLNLDRTAAIALGGLVSGAPLVYALWVIRSGVLLGSYLSALPAWRFLDPLPVLAQAADDEEGEEDEEALSPVLPNAPDPLRGFA